MCPITIHQIMSFLGKTTFCAKWHEQLLSKTTFCAKWHEQLHLLCHVIQSEILNVYYSSPHLFCSFHLSLPALHQLWRLSQLQKIPVLLWFFLPHVDITTDAMLSHWAFYFHGSGVPLSCCHTWPVSFRQVAYCLTRTLGCCPHSAWNGLLVVR